jgi:benzoyl-CoA reductase subunit C
MDHYPGAAAFHEAVHSRSRVLRDSVSRGNKAIGYFCTYTPVEIIHASGFTPVRIWGGTGCTEEAHTFVPSFICPFMRQSLEKALHGEFDFLTGLVQGYTCDVACGMLNIWRENIPLELYHSMALPYNDNASSRSFLRSSLVDLSTTLSRIGGRFTDYSLETSLDLYASMRSILAQLAEMRMMGTLPLTAGDFLSVVQAGFSLDPEEYLVMLKDLMKSLEHSDKGPAEHGFPVLVSGSVIDNPDTFSLMEELGFRIVSDDLCTGYRNFTPVSGKGNSPMERLIDRIMNRFPCPSRSHPRDRIPLLRDLVTRSGAKGVIFIFQKFCSPHLADHPMVSEAFTREGIPSIVIELDETGTWEAQMRTRLETFSGMLGG